MKNILGFGNALVDALVRIDDDAVLDELSLPKGSMQLVDDERQARIARRMEALRPQYATGGSACNTMLALGNLGDCPGLVGKVGCDAHGELFEQNCRDHGIRPHLLHCDSLPTGVAATFISADGERTFGTHLGAASQLTAEEFDPALLKGYGYVYIEGYLVQNHALILAIVRAARRAGLLVCLDLASYNVVEAERDFFAELIPLTDIVFANTEEALALTRAATPEAALGAICRMAADGATAVVKLGKRGAVAQRGSQCAEAAAVPVEPVVDTTGAGDFFAAGFLYAHVRNLSLDVCLQRGNELAGRVIRIIGTALPEADWQAIRSGFGADNAQA